MFQQQLIYTDESSRAQFSVTFTPQLTEIPFTIVVETNGSYANPVAVEGLSCNINRCM